MPRVRRNTIGHSFATAREGAVLLAWLASIAREYLRWYAEHAVQEMAWCRQFTSEESGSTSPVRANELAICCSTRMAYGIEGCPGSTSSIGLPAASPKGKARTTSLCRRGPWCTS